MKAKQGEDFVLRGYMKSINHLKQLKWIVYDCVCHSNKYKTLKLNRTIENKYAGSRVFIVANGPSIKNENLGLLKGEKIFTVNQMIRKKEFAELNPIANFWFDPAYFDEKMPDSSKKEFEDLFMKTYNCSSEIISFVPYGARDFLIKHKLDMERVYYVDTSLYFYDQYKKDFRFTGLAPTLQNIVEQAIAMAVYMGFKEIYLLGVDSTGIITKINSVLEQSIEDCYTYELGTSGQNYVNSLLDYFSVEEQFLGWTRIFHQYKELYKYCSDREIKLINCSSKTIIEGIPRLSLESVLHNEEVIE